ncbi:MAG: hypothetical protein Q8R31_06290 [Candidatus Omnitrophota bacterium]|nr:hypothetical protein [Candidatus Omnitrophota bacterium]
MKPAIKDAFFLFSVFCLLFSAIGCDAFVRKFTRKQKKENLPKQEMVLAPEEYKPPKMTKEEVYRQYFLYWKSWHDELINSLSGGASNKKQIDCANEAIKNLGELRAILQEAGQKKLDVYINQLKALNKEIAEDLYGNDISLNRLTAERIRRGILRDFSYNKIKDYLT